MVRYRWPELSTAVSDNPAVPVRGEQRVAADYTLVTAAGALSALLSFVSATLTTRLLAPGAFGALSLVLVTSLILQMVTSAWSSLAVARFGREALDLDGTMSGVTRARLTIVMPWYFVAALAIVALKAAGGLPGQLTWPLVGAALLHGTIATFHEHCLSLLRSWGRQRLAAAAMTLQQLLLVIVIAVLLATGSHAGALSISLLYGAGSMVLLLLYVPLLYGVALRRVPRDRALEQRIWRFSAPLIAFTAGSYVVGSIDLWVLSAFASPATVGTYAAAYRAYTVLMTIAAAATPVLMPLFVSLRIAGRGEEIGIFVERTVPALVLLAGALTAVLVAPAYAAAPLVFGSAFGAAALPLAILLVGVLAYLECCLLGSVLTAYDRTADTARAMLAAALLNVIGDVVAIGVLGAGSWAPAAATVASGLLVAFAYARTTGACTGTPARLVLGAYAAPAAAVVALVLAPGSWHVWASLGAGALAAAATLIIARHTLIDLRRA
jgi:O-antigen/teichoic acid export membrane protein